MRTEILDFLQAENLGVFTTSREQPWSENATPLYIKNLKKIYVSQDQVEAVPLITTLDGMTVPSEVTTVTVYLACDAKQTPPNLDQVIEVMRTAKDITTLPGIIRRECSIDSSYQADILVTEFTFRFTNIK